MRPIIIQESASQFASDGPGPLYWPDKASLCAPVHHGGQHQGTDARASITEAEGRSARYIATPNSAGEQYIR